MNYETFEHNGAKAFCQSCAKYVHDFRGKDEKFLNDVLKNNQEACGIFYMDQVRNKKQIPSSSLYNYFSLKVLSGIVFIKSFLFVADSKAAEFTLPKISQGIADDSTAIKMIYERASNRTRHQIVLYINNELISEHAYPIQGFIYLPDNLKPNDKIKIKVLSNKIIKPKTYRFKYKEVQKITIRIKRKKEIELFKRPYVMGCPSNFW